MIHPTEIFIFSLCLCLENRSNKRFNQQTHRSFSCLVCIWELCLASSYRAPPECSWTCPGTWSGNPATWPFPGSGSSICYLPWRNPWGICSTIDLLRKPRRLNRDRPKIIRSDGRSVLFLSENNSKNKLNKAWLRLNLLVLLLGLWYESFSFIVFTKSFNLN